MCNRKLVYKYGAGPFEVLPSACRKNGCGHFFEKGFSSFCQPEVVKSCAEQQKRLLRTSTSPLGTVSRFAYDAKGNCTESITEKDDLRIQTQVVLEADQNRVAAKIDARGKQVTQQTDAARGTLSWVQDPKGQRVNYTYDAMKRVVRTESVQDAKRYHNDYTYQGDKLVQVRHNTSDNAAEDVTYAFAYDAVNRPTAVRVGKQLLSETAYNANGTVQKVTYGNGGKAAYTYDSFKRVTGVTYDGAAKPRFQYAHDNHGQIAQVTDTEMGRVITSEYDLADRPMRKTTRFVDGSTYVAQVGYDTFSNLQHFTEKISGIGTFKTTFAYDTENRPTKLDFGGAGQVSYTYDGLGRLQNQTVTVGKTPILSAYGYVLGGHGTGSTSHLVETIAQMGAYLSYIYDDCGNIIAVSDGVKQIS